MPKLFCVSDIHSHFTPLKKALDEAGFDPNNENHWLISLGDAFDRGSESKEVLEFLMNLERKVLIKGNHDILLKDLCEREFPYHHDKSNGTFRTVIDFGHFNGRNFDECCRTTYNKLARYRELLVNYFETQNYIFVHSWIPTIKKKNSHSADGWVINDWMEDWRNAAEIEWEDAMWGNPFMLADQDLNKTGKTIVFGHWHCSAGHKMLGNCECEFDDDAIWEPCYFKNTIGIDRCTAYTGKVNVLVLEDDFLDRK